MGALQGARLLAALPGGPAGARPPRGFQSWWGTALAVPGPPSGGAQAPGQPCCSGSRIFPASWCFCMVLWPGGAASQELEAELAQRGFDSRAWGAAWWCTRESRSSSRAFTGLCLLTHSPGGGECLSVSSAQGRAPCPALPCPSPHAVPRGALRASPAAEGVPSNADGQWDVRMGWANGDWAPLRCPSAFLAQPAANFSCCSTL